MGELAAVALESPDYSGAAETALEYIRESILDPDAYLAPRCSGGPCPPGLMPASLGSSLSQAELDAIVQYLVDLPVEGSEQAEPSEETSPVALGPAPESDRGREPRGQSSPGRRFPCVGRTGTPLGHHHRRS